MKDNIYFIFLNNTKRSILDNQLVFCVCLLFLVAAPSQKWDLYGEYRAFRNVVI